MAGENISILKIYGDKPYQFSGMQAGRNKNISQPNSVTSYVGYGNVRGGGNGPDSSYTSQWQPETYNKKRKNQNIKK